MLARCDPRPLQYRPSPLPSGVPGRMEFAAAIRHALLREQPKVVAVELPLLWVRHGGALSRLPEITVILYPDESEDDLVYVPVEPADPFTEAVRTALEIGAEVAFIEPDLLSGRIWPTRAGPVRAYMRSAMIGTSRCIARPAARWRGSRACASDGVEAARHRSVCAYCASSSR